MRAFLPLAVLGVLACSAGPVLSDPGDRPVKENRLAKERSPYLRQHRTNPVDWYPWGDEALARAKAENKPIFLSIGYAACHWCHVMEHESFEDEATAERMNEVFVCVKVDREERPDLDRAYMAAVQLFGRGGWPMTVLLLPDGRPFLGATYIPRERLHALIDRIEHFWKSEPDKLREQAATIADQVRRTGAGAQIPETDDTDAQILTTMRNALGANFDHVHGGYGSRPKFPPHTELLFFVEDHGRRAGPEERAQVVKTLDAMIEGGIHDQVGGGFHRYSTDERWLLPHFEKMLYDNALLARALSGAYAMTGSAHYKRAAARTFDWLEREMARPGGGYASSLDADTDGEEGLTYTWTVAELRAVLGAEAMAWVPALFGVEPHGNFRDEATRELSGRNILHLPRPLAIVAKERGETVAALQARVDATLETLRRARDERAQPGLDDKVITGWNGLLVSAFARAGAELGEPRYLDRARALAQFLLQHCRREDGALLRFPAASGPEIPGFCEDYVHLVEGLLDLHATTGEAAWLDAARGLAVRLNAEFQDEEAGGFRTTSSKEHEPLFAPTKEAWDSPIPSDNGTAAALNLRLQAATGEASFGAAADRTLSTFRPMMAHPRMVGGVMGLLRALALRMELERAGAAGASRGDVRQRLDVAEADVFLERLQARPGTRVRLVVRVRLDAGWHVNAHVASREALVPTSLAMEGASPAALEDVLYPPARAQLVGGEKLAVYGGTFEIRAALAVPADAPAGPRRIPLRLRFQACDEGSCKAPATMVLDLPLRFDAEDGAAQHPALFSR